tara:strand:+ start:49 stop:408 length:360 start_codon:yes stop_codon:yes gene_type:complete
MSAGAGAEYNDNCNYDDLSSDPSALIVNSYDKGLAPATYAETCAATTVSVPGGSLANTSKFLLRSMKRGRPIEDFFVVLLSGNLLVYLQLKVLEIHALVVLLRLAHKQQLQLPGEQSLS